MGLISLGSGKASGVLLSRCGACGLVAMGSLPSAVFAHDVGRSKCRGEMEPVADFRRVCGGFAEVSERDGGSGHGDERALARAGLALDPFG
jgi:hypothetical protein